MRSCSLSNVLLALALLCLQPVAQAKSEEPQKISLESASPAQVLDIVQEWKAKFDDGDVLLSGKAAVKYKADLQELTQWLESLQSWDALSADQRIKLVNSYESLRAQTDGGIAAGNRRICNFEKRIGSNMRTNVCVTAAEQKRRDQDNRRYLENADRYGRVQHINGN